MKSFMKHTFTAAALLVLGFAVGRGCAAGRSTSSAESDGAGSGGAPVARETVWTCSMHPQVRLPEPDPCPICGMDLVPASDEAAGGGAGPVLELSPEAAALAEIETAPVERRSVARRVDMVGKIALDETRMATITAWVPGRLDRLFVDSEGVSVRAGDHLVEVYSPTLYAAQQELLQAIATSKRIADSSLDLVRDATDRTVVSAREKLRLYGLADEQIQDIVERGVPDERVTVRAPIGGVVVQKSALEGMYVEEGTRIYSIADLSKVWVLLEAYESDLAWLRYGQDVEFQVEAYPGEVFHGRVAFIDPLLDDRTRTVKVRLNVENEGLRLKPEMFVSATGQARLTEHGKVVDPALEGKWMCPMHPEVVAEEASDCPECEMDLVPAAELGFVARPAGDESLVVPATAPLITGKRAVVYVRLPDRDRPTFEGREIVLGPRAGDWYVVRAGLEEGELVVVHGNFKIDSELQIRARPSMMNPAHEAPAQAEETPRTSTRLDGVPRAFQEGVGAVVSAYLELQQALAGDHDDPAAAGALGAAVRALEGSALDERLAGEWGARREALSAATLALEEAPDLEARRVRLAPVSEHVLDVAWTFGFRMESGASTIGQFHCPMALDGGGADWLQVGDTPANPYFGSSMLRCGAQTAELASGD